jgi:hypothetical protein
MEGLEWNGLERKYWYGRTGSDYSIKHLVFTMPPVVALLN